MDQILLLIVGMLIGCCVGFVISYFVIFYKINKSLDEEFKEIQLRKSHRAIGQENY